MFAACRAVIYTPGAEHFGYVPLEAMAAGRPVVAVNHGGPTETVIHDRTGLLCEPEPEAFATALATLVTRVDVAREMGRADGTTCSASSRSTRSASACGASFSRCCHDRRATMTTRCQLGRARDPPGT